MDKHEAAHILDEIGVLLSLKGENPFKIRAYHNAARAIENLDEDLDAVVKEKRLEDLPGIGERIAKKLMTLVLTGRLPYYEKLKKSIPKSILDLLNVPGLGAKKVKILFEKLKVRTIKDLTEACKKDKVAKLAGFGPKTQENILNGITKLKNFGKRRLYWNAEKTASFLLEKFSKLKEVDKVDIAGSFRRKLETIGDLDILVASSSPAKIMKWFSSQPFVEKVISSGPTKTSVFLKENIQVDLRVVPKDEYGFALLYFTGSKDHNIRLRQLANKMGYSLSEYGLELLKGRRPKPLAKKKLLTEKDIYEAFGLSYIPPELREDMGEIEIARKGKLPALIEEKDIRGLFHCHTTESDGHNTLEEMVLAAQKLGMSYIGISDHSKSSFQANGLDEKRLYKQIETIRKLNRSKKFSTYVFSGLECDILPNGKLDFPDDVLEQLDFVIVSVHSVFTLSEKAMTDRLIKAIENPYSTMVGHLTGRLLLQRDPYLLNTRKVIDACIANRKIVELNAHPMRLDMDWRQWHYALSKGLTCSINPDAHSTSDLVYYRAGVNVARKGWLQKKDVINTLSLSQIQKILRKKRKG